MEKEDPSKSAEKLGKFSSAGSHHQLLNHSFDSMSHDSLNQDIQHIQKIDSNQLLQTVDLGKKSKKRVVKQLGVLSKHKPRDRQNDNITSLDSRSQTDIFRNHVR